MCVGEKQTERRFKVCGSGSDPSFGLSSASWRDSPINFNRFDSRVAALWTVLVALCNVHEAVVSFCMCCTQEVWQRHRSLQTALRLLQEHVRTYECSQFHGDITKLPQEEQLSLHRSQSSLEGSEGRKWLPNMRYFLHSSSQSSCFYFKIKLLSDTPVSCMSCPVPLTVL